MASPSSSSSPSPPPPPPPPLLPRSSLCTPIPEMDKEVDEEDEEVVIQVQKQQVPAPTKKKKSGDNHQLSVLCNSCRPSKSRDSSKSTSVVPLDRNYHTTPPSKLLHSLLLRIKSPSTSTPSEADPTDWKLVAHDLSRKLLLVTRHGDNALLEASRLKHTVSDLELKLSQLESHCLNLERTLAATGPAADNLQFTAAVAETRTAVRFLTRSLAVQIRPTRIASILKLPIPDTATLLIYIESLLNKVFFSGYENLTEGPQILDPKVRCEMSRASYEKVKGLTWEDVLCKGTKYYSEGLSRFCDEKMGEIVGVLGWTRGWSEGLLQAFFGASKAVWVVGLLGRCVYPPVTAMRVERGAGFDGRFMEDVVGGKVMPVSVRVMVAPGFYLYDNKEGFKVVKCRVICGVQ